MQAQGRANLCALLGILYPPLQFPCLCILLLFQLHEGDVDHDRKHDEGLGFNAKSQTLNPKRGS